MKMEVDKEWLEKRAAAEGDLEIGAGRRTKTIDLTPEEITELEELALNALPEWAQKEIRAYRAITAAPASAAEPSERERWQAWARKRLEIQHKHWLRAAKSALAGDMRELRNRVELSEAAPVEIVQSDGPEVTP